MAGGEMAGGGWLVTCSEWWMGGGGMWVAVGVFRGGESGLCARVARYKLLF